MTRDIFMKTVRSALRSLPKEFQVRVEDVEILVEDFADEETLLAMGITSRWDLLGLYQGQPMPAQSFFGFNPYPERIFLYRRPILRAAGRLENVPAVVYDVLLHEIGHHFGFDDEQLYAMTPEDA